MPTFPAAAPTWSEHPRPPSCPCLDCRHLALCQSHLKRTVTGPAIKMDKSQSTLLCLLSTSQISKIHSKLWSFIWAITDKNFVFFFGKEIIMKGLLLDGWYLERLFLISVIIPATSRTAQKTRISWWLV